MRRMSPCLAAALYFLIGCCLMPSSSALSVDNFKGKNVVLFITDQERRTQNFPANWEEENMPGLQRLKANGVTFKRAYTNSVTCSPARANMLTGILPAQHGVRYKLRYDMPANQYPQVELPTDVANLATIAKAAGYNVVYKGKIDVLKGANSTIATPADLLKYGFTRWNPPDSGLGNGLGEFGGGNSSAGNNDYRYMASRAANSSQVEDGLEGALQYVTDVAPLQQPFFLVVSLINPHDVIFYPTGLFTSAGYNSTNLQGNIEIPPTAYEELTPTKPSVQPQFNVISNQVLGPLNTTDLQKNYVNFYGNLLKTSDNYLVQLLDALAPLINNTLVIKISDHGEVGLSHGLTRQKCYNMYEEATNVPLVFSNPIMFPTPRLSDALVSHIDLAPTLAEILGQSTVAKFEGISYAPILMDKATSIQDYVVFTMEDYQIGQSQPPYVSMPADMTCIRESEWKFCKYYDPSAEVTKVKSQFEMYDLINDPAETVNLAYSNYNRTAAQEAQYKRLNKKLKEVKATRLVARRVEHALLLTLSNLTSSGTSSRVGTVGGIPVGSGNVTLVSTPGSNKSAMVKMTISSGSGIIRGVAKTVDGKGTLDISSGTGAYTTIKGTGLEYIETDGTISIGGIAKY